MKTTGQTTMRHVAERAGVSYQTVSRVINDAGGLVSSPDAEDPALSAHRRLVRRRAVDGVIVEAGRGEEGIALLVEAG